MILMGKNPKRKIKTAGIRVLANHYLYNHIKGIQYLSGVTPAVRIPTWIFRDQITR